MSKPNSLVFAVLLTAFPTHSARADVEVAMYPGDSQGALCTVSDSGYYALSQTRIGRADASGGERLEITVRVGDDRVVFKTEGGPGDTFDTPLGFVAKGSTIHVNAGDETSVGLDYTVVRKDVVTVAGFQGDFQAAAFPSGWRYMWNQPVGYTTSSPGDLRSAEIGDPAQYTDLVWDETNQTYSPHGDGDYSRTPSGLLRLGRTLGSPGFAYGERVSTLQDRYVIASCEVGAAGFYAITDSCLKESDTGDGDAVEVLIHIDDHSPILRSFSRTPADTVTFDTDLGYLEAGSRIFVCIGPKTTEDGDLFWMDYRIVRLDGGKSIRDQIAGAAGSRVRIFPTRYYFDSQQINLNAVTDFQINGYGATYLLTNHDEKFMTLRSCRNVRILGLTMDYDPLHFTQGRILGIEGTRVTLKPHLGYPTPKIGQGHYSTKALAHDPSTMRWKLETTVSRVVKVSQAGDDYVLEMSSDPRELNWAVGDYMSCYEKGVGRVIALTLCEDTLLKDLTLYQYGGWGISSSKGVRETFDGLRLTRGPKPLLATVERLRAGDCDGINLYTAEAPTIRNCLIEANCDDAIHVWGVMSFVLKDVNDSSVVQVSSRGNIIQEGMEVYLQAPSGKLIRTVTRCNNSAVSAQETETILSGLYPRLRLNLGFLNNRCQLTLDEPVTLAAGDMVYPPAKCGKGLRIENNVIRNDPGRGIVLKCVDGVITNNDISYMGGGGVKAELEAEIYGTGGFAENLLIRSNRFDSVAAHTARTARLGKAGAILIQCAGKELMRFDNIHIKGNTFVDCFGVNVVITDAMNVILKGNWFINPGHHTSEYGVDYDPTVQDAVIWVDNVLNVVLDAENRNYYSNKAPSMKTTAGGQIEGRLYPGPGPGPGHVVLGPVADDYIQAPIHSDDNFESSLVLRCKEYPAHEDFTRWYYPRFDLSSVISKVLSATLRLKVAEKREGAKDFEVHSVRLQLHTLPTGRNSQPRSSERLVVSNRKGVASRTKQKRTA